MRRSNCVFCLLLALLLSVSLTIPAYADTGVDNPDGPPAGTSTWDQMYGDKTPGKTYTVTATTATGITKTFTLDTTDMEDHVKTWPGMVHKADGTIIDGIKMTYIPAGDAPTLDTQCIIVPDGTEVLGTFLLSGNLDFLVVPKTVKHLEAIRPRNTDYVILYEGTEAQWNNIELSDHTQDDNRATVANAVTLFNCNYYDVAAGRAAEEAAAAAAAEAAVPLVSGFTDVKATDYCAEPVKWAVEKGITSGVTKTAFKPGDTCTQAQIITFIWRSQGSPEPSGTAPFNISPDKYYFKAANWAYSKGIIDDYFNPNGSCSRAMAMMYLYKLSGSPAVDHTGVSTFWDVSKTDSSYDAVCWAVNAGITKGTSDSAFSPSQTCTRGQIVTFLYRALVK